MIDLAAYVLEPLHQDGACLLYRGTRRCRSAGGLPTLLVVAPVGDHPALASLRRHEHEYALRATLEPAWAVRPLALTQHQGRPVLVLEDPGGEPLARLLRGPMALTQFLRLAIGLAAALGHIHDRGLVHKDIKPANILVHGATSQVWLMGFGLASQLRRERQAPDPPEVIAGTLAYMAPEQTGRMNRSIDARSDLYALGVTLYELLTGRLPFTAADPMEWVHCHIARQPVPPSERVPEVPPVVSAIIMKLLAKMAEDRYQTAAGVEHDLRRCLAAWETQRRIDPFPLGAHDTPDRLVVPEKLYGRARAIEILLTAFEHVVTRGIPELVLISGYAGIGKSAVVHELHKVLVPPRGLFASGKFDQYKRDIPYATLAQALQSLLRPLLGKSAAALASWREALHEALGPHGQLMVDLVPELTLILGAQPPVPELPPQDAQRRFQLVFRRFLGVFARPDHPLALFLDDLQWLDAATLEDLEELVTQPEVQHVLLIGAYRDNEVDAAHPLRRTLAALRHAGAPVQEIRLAPLARDDVGQLMAEALRCEPARVAPLAHLVHEKTGGNPFFLRQFLDALADAGLLVFDYEKARWSWDLERLQAKGYTENVVELMVGKLRRLPRATQTALQQLACLGNLAEITILSIVLGTSAEQVQAALWEAVRLELVERLADAYRFVHDRVQEAAYALIPEALCAEAHLRIGRLLLARTAPDQREEAIFEIVNQLNRGAALITAREEREQLAELNLIAGQRAKTTAAYAAALIYLSAGAALLAEDGWERQHALAFALALHRAECEFLTGEQAAAETRLADLARRAAALPDVAAVTRLRVELFMFLGRFDSAVEVALDYLCWVGVGWSAHPTPEEVRLEYDRIWQQLGDRPIEALLDLPRMADPVACETMDVLNAVVSAALHVSMNLRRLVIGRMVTLSLEHGNSDASCLAYALAGAVLGPEFGDYKVGYRFGQLGFDLVERYGLDRFKARVYLAFGSHVNPWTRHVRTSCLLLRHAFDTAQQAGDLNCAVYSRQHLVTHLLASGDPLGEVQREAEAGLDFARQARFGLIVDRITEQLQLIRTLRGLTPAFGCFDDAGFDEERFERHLDAVPRLTTAACWYWIRKLQARVLAHDHVAAIAAAANAERLLLTSPALFERAEYHFYAALARAALGDTAPAAERARHLEALAGHHRQLHEWAGNCPENFENRAALVGAEIARLDGRELDAERLYEQAIRAARANGFVHNEALAYERASAFYRAGGFDEFAETYLWKARACYARWGADGKVRQLDQLHPHLRQAEPVPDARGTIGAPLEHLDLATIIKVSQAVSGEIVLENLLDTLMRTAVEQAGAERALLILPRGDEPWIEAEATTSGDTVSVRLTEQAMTAAALPESIVHYVIRTRESVLLDDAAAPHAFAADAYIGAQHARSILCVPLLNQAKLTGVLYLENTLTPHVFTPTRSAVLTLLASQAAISLENARLYAEHQRDAAALREQANLLSLTHDAIFVRDMHRVVTYWNRGAEALYGWTAAEVAGTVVHDLLQTVFPAPLAQIEAALLRAGRWEGELVHTRKDGTRLVVTSRWSVQRDERGAPVVILETNTDITERKRAEEALRQAQAELTHVTRVMTLGELAASIAHEINQPLAAIVTNGSAGLRWLTGAPPHLEDAREVLQCIIDDGQRAGEVITRLRALLRKSAPEQARLDLPHLVHEVVRLTQPECLRQGVALHVEVAADLPPVVGDRVQVQQVLLNLVLNSLEALAPVTERPREVWIRVQPEAADTVRVAVEDNGVGLAPEQLDQMFTAFYTTKAQGLGMGLAISRTIVEQHGGRLWAVPHAGPGVTVQFTLRTAPEKD